MAKTANSVQFQNRTIFPFWMCSKRCREIWVFRFDVSFPFWWIYSCVRHVSFVRASDDYAYGWAMPHKWRSHGTHLNASCHRFTWYREVSIFKGNSNISYMLVSFSIDMSVAIDIRLFGGFLVNTCLLFMSRRWRTIHKPLFFALYTSLFRMHFPLFIHV